MENLAVAVEYKFMLELWFDSELVEESNTG